MEEIVLLVEEMEAIRLKDYLGMEQEECARKMQVSRPTFQRILIEGRAKIAEALIAGKAIRIEGGDYCLGENRCRRRERLGKEMNDCPYSRIGARGGNDQQRSPDQEENIIAVCSSGDSMDSMVDGHFGRCPYFILWDEETNEPGVLNNKDMELNHGAGTGLAQALLNKGVAALICSRIGPKAFTVLNRAGIKIFGSTEGITVATALEKYRAGELEPLESANN
jgi:predicted DNA-binding protein (UPF0251 family)/predicted Fe-Mo cluster-binding NifX family protein